MVILFNKFILKYFILNCWEIYFFIIGFVGLKWCKGNFFNLMGILYYLRYIKVLFLYSIKLNFICF